VKRCHWILIVLLSVTAVFGAVAAPIDDPATPISDAAYSAALAPRTVARIRSLSPAPDLAAPRLSINVPVIRAANSLDVLNTSQRRSRSLQILLCTLLI